MEQRDDRGGDPGGADARDQEIAREAGAMGAAGISRSTGTGSAGSGLAAGGGRGLDGTEHAATTGPTTDQAEDLADAAGPSSAGFGGTGEAGSGLGAAPGTTGITPQGTRVPSSAAGGGTASPGSTGAQASGGSDAGGAGGLGSA